MNQLLVCILGVSASLIGCDCGNAYRYFTLQVDTVDIINPNPVTHKGTVVVFHGYAYYGIPMINDLLAYGFDMGPDVRVVTLEARATEANPWPAWFPFLIFPWDGGVFGDLGDKVILQQSSEVILSHLQTEAELLGGDWGRIFLYGLSQGGMIASWMGLMSSVRFGGVVNQVGCFPLMSMKDIVKHPDIPIVDYHDPLDTGVPWRFVEGGREAAIGAGASQYEPIVETTGPKQNHHAPDRGGIAAANEWIKSKLLP